MTSKETAKEQRDLQPPDKEIKGPSIMICENPSPRSIVIARDSLVEFSSCAAVGKGRRQPEKEDSR